VLKTKIKGNGSVWVESGIVLVLRYGVGILAALQGGRACVWQKLVEFYECSTHEFEQNIEGEA
jgi:hypothetical protein